MLAWQGCSRSPCWNDKTSLIIIAACYQMWWGNTDLISMMWLCFSLQMTSGKTKELRWFRCKMESCMKSHSVETLRLMWHSLQETEHHGNALCCCQEAVYGCIIPLLLLMASIAEWVIIFEDKQYPHSWPHSMLPSQVLNLIIHYVWEVPTIYHSNHPFSLNCSRIPADVFFLPFL